MKIDWAKIQKVHDLANSAQVSYTLHYSEADCSWFFSVSSAAPSEEWIGRNHSFEIAIECVTEFLEGIVQKSKTKQVPRHGSPRAEGL